MQLQQRQPEVTALKPLKQAGFFSVLSYRRKLARLHQSRIDALGITVGTIWTPELAAQAASLELHDYWYRKALARLNRRAVSSKELHRWMLEQGLEAQLADRITERLKEIGALNDRMLADSLVHHHTRIRPAGERLIRTKLRQRGIDEETGSAALDGQLDPDTMLEQARTLAQRKTEHARRRSSDDATAQERAKAQAKLYRQVQGLLARRGFPPRIIEQVTEEIAAQAGFDPASEAD